VPGIEFGFIRNPNLTPPPLLQCQVSSLEGLEAVPQLEVLELGFNLIKRVQGMAALPKLHTLELNNNLLYRIEDVAALRRYNIYICMYVYLYVYIYMYMYP